MNDSIQALEEKREALLSEMVAKDFEIIDLQMSVGQAKMRAHVSGQFADPTWFRVSESKLIRHRHRKQEINVAVQNIDRAIGHLKAKARREHETTREKLFIQYAKLVLPADVYLAIWKKVNEKKAKRAALGMSDRWSIMTRDGFKCGYCGKSAEEGASLEVDHKISVDQGGTDDADNLITACLKCNRSKSSRSYVATKQELSSPEAEPPLNSGKYAEINGAQ